jgi:hypothetical protein
LPVNLQLKPSDLSKMVIGQVAGLLSALFKVGAATPAQIEQEFKRCSMSIFERIALGVAKFYFSRPALFVARSFDQVNVKRY